MSFQTTAIKYGWVYLTALGVITGTTIYVANNIRKQVKPEDVIEIALGTHERCLATQYQTNPVAYRVTPPSFVRTWTSNVYTTNGVTVYTNIVTNTIGWHTDRQMMIDLDVKIKALVPWYVDTNTVYDGTTNIVMLTVTGLWASLQIGDKTNKFTRTPAWTNPVSTNWIVNYTSYWPSTNGTATNINYTSDYRQVVNYATSWTATGGHIWVTSSNWQSYVTNIVQTQTFGDYPWQIYEADLVERYKVLEALKMTRDYRKENINGSRQGHSGYFSWYRDLEGYTFSNLTTGVTVGPAYRYYSTAHILGLENMYDYVSDTNYVNIGNEQFHKMSYGELQTLATYHYVHHSIINNPPWSDYPDGYTSPTNLTGLGAGGYIAFTKTEYASAGGPVLAWYWFHRFGIDYSTWGFNKKYPGQQITNTAALYLKPTLPTLPTEIVDAGDWTYPRTWNVTVDGCMGELIGMPTNVWTKMDNSFAVVTGNTFTVEFGSDEFGPLTTVGSLQSFPNAPTEGVGPYDNTGSVGTMKGSYLAEGDYFFLKTWQFNYATNKFW